MANFCDFKSAFVLEENTPIKDVKSQPYIRVMAQMQKMASLEVYVHGIKTLC